MKYSIRITKSKKRNKRLDAIFTSESDSSVHRVSFGQFGGSTYIDHKDKTKQSAYLKRHIVNEVWSDPFSAGALSRWILWNKPTLEASLRDYSRRFGIKID